MVFQQSLISHRLSLMVFMLGILTSLPAKAGVVVSNGIGNAGISALFAGQSVTTPTGGPWNNIAFNFDSPAGGGTPFASGTLFVLTQAYAGTPAALSNSTPGFLASTSTISANTWLFSTLTLNPSTQYFFYSATSGVSLLRGANGDPFPGGNAYSSSASNTNFASLAATDLNFTLQGNIVAVPEPSSIALIGIALSGFALRGWRRRSRLGMNP